MNRNFLAAFPPPGELTKRVNGIYFPQYREANGHIHTPYSFSAFDNLEMVFSMAKAENVAILGINDFFVADGYEAFNNGCIKNNIFPLFNIEFIGLLKEEQEKGIRINDPNNPGRIYFSGKGLDYPFRLGWLYKWQLKKVKKESQKQIKAMIGRLNQLIHPIEPSLTLSYDTVKRRFAHELVRERHLAKAVRTAAAESYSRPEDQLQFIESLYNGKKSKTGMGNPSLLENEIRSNLLKSGGAAFVEENENAFLNLGRIIRIIKKAGGIPCYPVLLDDPSGKFTEFEASVETLYSSLKSLGIGCIELIPGRNDHAVLKSFVEFFDEKRFIITFGTEHNTPEMIPLSVRARGATPLDDGLKRIAWKGVCIIAAHQYLRAQERQGLVLEDGTLSLAQKDDLEDLGQLVIEYFLNNRNHESGN